MRHLLIFLLLIFSKNVFCTVQRPDILIYNGEEYLMYNFPLEFFEEFTQRKIELYKQNVSTPTSGYRLYVAEWEIINNELFLTKINSNYSPHPEILEDMNAIFGEKLVNGRVKVNWYEGQVHAGYHPLRVKTLFDNSYFKKEIVFNISQGKIENFVTYFHPNSRKKEMYEIDYNDFIYSSINWELVPYIEDKLVYSAIVSGNESGYIDSIKLNKSCNKELDDEIIRVFKSMDMYEIYYKYGQHKRTYWGVPVILNEELRMRYNR